MSDCIFCSIVAGEAAADVVIDTEHTLFFRDINPKARVHLLGIPKEHIGSTAHLAAEHEAVAGELLRQAHEAAQQAGIAESGYRVIVNTGPDAAPEVGHLHVHVLGGEPLGPMRC